MDISCVSTKELVEELKRREGVEAFEAPPYSSNIIDVDDGNVTTFSGPAIILKVID